jgi:hypothetical protein
MLRKECIFAVLVLAIQAAPQNTKPVYQDPMANQSIVQPPTTMAPTTFSANNEAGIVYAVPSYNWTPQTPPGMLTGGVPNTVTLNPCPAGLLVLTGVAPFTQIWISGGGNSEAVVITSTSCPLQGGGSHTVNFVPVHSYANGYTVSSASQGIQEAINAATITPIGSSLQPGKVIVPPGSYTAKARISILGNKQYIDANGAVLICTLADTCLFVGEPGGSGNANITTDVTIDGLSVQAGYAGRYTAIEDDASHTILRGISTRNSSNGGTFSSVIQIDNDQSAVIEKFNPGSQNNWAHCGTDWCSVAIYGPGPFGTNAGVLWVKDSVIAAQCTFNGIDNQDANTLRVSDTIVEGYPQFGIRAVGSNNNVAATLDNVYMEVGACTNPLGLGIAGLISEGFTSVMHSTGPAGVLPNFGNSMTGQNLYAYYVVVKSSSIGTSAPFLAGYAYAIPAMPIPVKWPQVGNSGTITYDLLRQTVPDLGGNTAAPYGTGNFAVAKGISASANCSNNVCSFVDAGGVATSYTVTAPSTYAPALTFWPGSVILTESADSVTNNGGEPRLYADIVGQSTGITLGGFVNSYGANVPTVFAHQCSGLSTWSSIWVSCPAGDSVSSNFSAVGALLLQSGGVMNGGHNANLKGRLNFLLPSGDMPATHLITLADSNPTKTLATPGHRPSNDANDTWIGLDNPQAGVSGFQLAFGAPTFISSYIGNIGDNTNFLERLTASAKTFNIPVTANFQINSTLLTSSNLAPLTVKSAVPVDVLTVSNHPTIQYCGTGTTCQPAAGVNGQVVFGKITLSSSPQDMGGINPPFQHNTYNCLGNDLTTPMNGVKVVPKNTNTVTFTGTVGDTISYQCVGS